jgi:hypothetical protein
MAGERDTTRPIALLPSAPMPIDRDRSRVHEARIAGLAITVSAIALILVVVYFVGGYARHVVVQIVDSAAPVATPY